MKLAILGDIIDDTSFNLDYFLPREKIDLIITDDNEYGFSNIVEDYSKKNNIDYVLYKLEDYQFEDKKNLKKFYIQYKENSFLRNDLSIYHSDYILLFKINENPYVHYIEYLANSMNKKIKIEYLIPKKKFTRDPD